ncbi:MAG: ATP:corrinoid adenosyltransferase [uncultured bacterium]|nr:MAG: ATP:corrinoid adenosyltransferase [uncultured bacterium]HBY74195.1 cob(I)yrinic acid a,c-diamide adenosyltransferase [Candidatus Kerfeldbacteria bacterium]
MKKKVHLYTGKGKGKTAAALGTLLRAAGHGHRVLMIQFLNGDKTKGEMKAFQRLGEHVTILQFGRADLPSPDAVQTIDAYLANQALQHAREAMRSRRQRPDVLILDEIATAVDKQLLRAEDVVDMIDNRHQYVEIIMTGEAAHPALLNIADEVTLLYPAKP